MPEVDGASRSRFCSHRSEWGVRLLLAAAPVLLFELGLRASGFHFRPAPVEFVGPHDDRLNEPHYYLRRSEVCLWELRPHALLPPSMGDRINRDGYRGARLRRKVRGDTLRLALAGDSCAMGYHLQIEQTISERLEQFMFRQLGREVEVLNAGCTGHSTVQTYERLRAGVFDYRPRYMLLYVGQWNDYLPALGYTDREALRAARRFGRVSRLRSALAHLRIYQWLESIVERARRDWREIPLEQQVLADFRAGRKPALRRVPLPEFRNQVAAIVSLCRQHHAAPIGLIAPIPSSTQTRTPAALSYRRALIQVYRSEGVSLVDARGLDDQPDAFFDWIHPSASGAARIAAAFGRKLSRLEQAGLSLAAKPCRRQLGLDGRQWNLADQPSERAGNGIGPIRAHLS